MRWTLIGQFLFMRQSCSVRHAQLHTATLSRDKIEGQNHTIKLQAWHGSKTRKNYLSVYLSVTLRNYIKIAEWIKLVFRHLEATINLSSGYTVLEGNFKTTDTSLWNFAPNSVNSVKILQLHVDRRKCCHLRWTLSVINWRRSSVTSLSHWASHRRREWGKGGKLPRAPQCREGLRDPLWVRQPPGTPWVTVVPLDPKLAINRPAEHPPLCTTWWVWSSASRGSVFGGWDCYSKR